MAVSNATLGFGALLKRGDAASPEVFATIAEVFDIGEIGETIDQVEVTHHESPNTTREFITGLKEGDEFSVQANYVAGNSTQDESTGIISVFQAGTKHNYQIVKGAETLAFSAIVLHWGINFNLDDRMVLNVNMKLSSAISFS